MKTIVIYKSHAGSTKKYAEDLAKRLDGKAIPLRKIKFANLKNYTNVIFGGWVQNGKIVGIDKFLSYWEDMSDKHVFIFSVGIAVPSEKGRKDLIDDNMLDLYHLRFFQTRGSFNVGNLKFPYSAIVKSVIKQVEKNANAPLEQRTFVELRDHPIDFYDRESMDKIYDSVMKANAIVEV